MADPRDADATKKVIEYLSKKGYSKTEAMLRLESSSTGADGRPIVNRAEDLGGQKYTKAYGEPAQLSFLHPVLRPTMLY